MSHPFEFTKELGGTLSEPETVPSIVDPDPLGHIVPEEVSLQPGSRIVLHSDPRSVGADRFRFLRICLRELWNAGKLRSLLITSPLPQDGKSTVALNLATALAEGGKRKVLLIEADLHHASISDQLGLETRLGLTDCLEQNLNPLLALRRVAGLNWYLLSAGSVVGNPTELLQTAALATLLQKLSTYFDWILVDAPPVIPVSDSLALARQTNATLLVVREGRTPREAVEKTIAMLGKHRVLGIILNGVDDLKKLYSGYYGYSGNYGNNNPKLIGAGNTRTVVTPPRIPFKHSVIRQPED